MLRLVYIGCAALVLCLLTLLPLRALAYGTVPKAQGFEYRIDVPQCPGAAYCGLYPSPQALASAYGPLLGGSTVVGGSTCTWTYGYGSHSFGSSTGPALGTLVLQQSGTVSNGNSCVPAVGTVSRNMYRAVSPAACPADSTAVDATSCTCNSGFQPSNGQCVPTNCQAEAGGMGNTTLTWQGNTSSTCYRGCRMQCQVRGYQSSTGQSSCPGWAVFTTSESCQGSGNSGADAGTGSGAGTCPTGQCPGTVNGLPVCVACNSTTNGPSTSASAPGGAASAPPIPNAPPGTTTSEQTTQCGGGQCTTTTTYRDGNGNVTGSTDRREDQPSFCRENPQSPLCRDSTISGTCSAVQCNGDAIQCAIAREQAARNCQFFEPSGATVTAGTDAVQGGDRPSFHPGTQANSTSMQLSSVLDQTQRIGGSGCPSDIPVSVMGLSASIPLSSICGPLQTAGSVIVGFCLLAAAFIVFKG